MQVKGLTVAAAAGLMVATGAASAQSLDLADLQTVVNTGMSRPLFLTGAPGDPATRLYVVEQGGRIRVIENGVLQTTPFLDITTLVLGAGTNSEFGLTGDNEQGLLGLAFHPDYQTNGFFYVYYIAPRGSTFGFNGQTYDNGRSLVVRYTRSTTNPLVANAASAFTIMRIDQPFTNHNGGCMAFGPDGLLYIGTGDGGSANDPGNRALNPNDLMGKLLRIDVNSDGFPADANANYAIPADNPTSWPTSTGTTTTIRREIWAVGLRNPWRWSFDRQNGDLWIGDVGQGDWEEVNWVPGNGGPGRNYGWRVREGLWTTGLTGGTFATTGLTDPVYQYAHDSASRGGFPLGTSVNWGQSITGGYVYRGTAIPGWRGRYFFADFVSNRVWSVRGINGVATDYQIHTTQLGNPASIGSFGQDNNGEMYIVQTFGSPQIRRIVPSALSNSLSPADIVQIGGAPGPDNALTGDDFIAYINAFASGDLLADIVGIGGTRPPDNQITGDDFIAFINAFAGN